MQKRVESILTNKKSTNVLLIFLVCLTILFKIGVLWGIFLSIFFFWISASAVSIICIGIIVKSIRNRNLKRILLNLFIILFVVSLQFVQVHAFRFRLFSSVYEKEANKIHAVVNTADDGRYIELPEENSWLGKVSYFKRGTDVLILFEERYTLFDCFCYVRDFSQTPINTVLEGAPKIEKLNEDWYYVNLF